MCDLENLEKSRFISNVNAFEFKNVQHFRTESNLKIGDEISQVCPEPDLHRAQPRGAGGDFLET